MATVFDYLKWRGDLSFAQDLVGTPVAACIVVEPTRRTAKNSATSIVAIGCSCPMSAIATPSKP